jgi:endonuclease YncB( thermonuclease family)
MTFWQLRCVGLLALIVLLAAPLSARAGHWQGTVVAIADGDTLTLLDGAHRTHRIRLDGIDAPERKQAYGQRAR